MGAARNRDRRRRDRRPARRRHGSRLKRVESRRPRRRGGSRRRQRDRARRRRASTGWSSGCASENALHDLFGRHVGRGRRARGARAGRRSCGGEERDDRRVVRRRDRLHRRSPREPPAERRRGAAQRVLRDRGRGHRRRTAGWSTSSRATPRCASSALRSPGRTPRAPRCAPRASSLHAWNASFRRSTSGSASRPAARVAGNIGAEQPLRVHGHRRSGQRGGTAVRARKAAPSTAARLRRRGRSRRPRRGGPLGHRRAGDATRPHRRQRRLATDRGREAER